MAEKQLTIFGACVNALGPVKGANVVTFIGHWALTMEKAGDRWDLMTKTAQVEYYGTVAGLSRSQAFRNFARYRQVFKTDPTALIRKAGIVVKTEKQANDVWTIGLAT